MKHYTRENNIEINSASVDILFLRNLMTVHKKKAVIGDVESLLVDSDCFIWYTMTDILNEGFYGYEDEMADGGVGIDDNNDEDDDDCEALTKPVTMILMKVSVLFW